MPRPTTAVRPSRGRAGLAPAGAAHRRRRHAARVGRLPRGGAPLPHRAGRLHLRHAAVPAVRRHQRAHRPAHGRRRQFDHRDRRPHRQSRQRCAPTTCRRSTTRRCSAATRYLCLYCGARFADQLLSRDHVAPFSRGGQDIWSNVVTACRRCNNAKASRTPEQAGMQLLAVPFTPTYAEYIYLKGRRVLADQMEYLLAHFPRSSPLHERMPRWPTVTRRRRRLPRRRQLLRLPRLLLDARPTWPTPTAGRSRAVRLRALPRRT